MNTVESVRLAGDENLPAKPSTVADIIEEYERKAADAESAIATFKEAITAMQFAAVVQGTYAESIMRADVPHIATVRKNLLQSGWKAVANRVNFHQRATAKDKQLFDRTLAAPPPLTFDSAVATFGDYLERPRFHALRGLAEVFSTLDPAYKSHSKVKIGVKGLPKRVIVSGFGSFHNTYANNKLTDIINALALVQNLPLLDWPERDLIRQAHNRGADAVLEDRGLTLRLFSNGNLHVFFAPETLRLINHALAEFYGDVLPDAADDDAAPSQSTAVAKDLQFYWTPEEVAEKASEYCDIWSPQGYSGDYPRLRILEPSCGDGRLMDAAAKYGHKLLGFEYHAGRAAEARAKGHSVVTGNFLEQEPTADFDRVLMNPPFYGRHYAKHVRHALRFLKSGGTLVAILPATARYDHNELTDLGGEWLDLPTASFAPAGTNVPTVMLRLRVKD